MIKKTKILPSKFKAVREKFTSARLMPFNINSKDIKTNKRFLRRRTPKKPIENKIKDRTR
jgi:hypothetical protein